MAGCEVFTEGTRDGAGGSKKHPSDRRLANRRLYNDRRARWTRGRSLLALGVA